MPEHRRSNISIGHTFTDWSGSLDLFIKEAPFDVRLAKSRGSEGSELRYAMQLIRHRRSGGLPFELEEAKGVRASQDPNSQVEQDVKAWAHQADVLIDKNVSLASVPKNFISRTTAGFPIILPSDRRKYISHAATELLRNKPYVACFQLLPCHASAAPCRAPELES